MFSIFFFTLLRRNSFILPGACKNYLMHFQFYYWFLGCSTVCSRSVSLPVALKANTNNKKDNGCARVKETKHCTQTPNAKIQFLHCCWNDVDLALILVICDVEVWVCPSVLVSVFVNVMVFFPLHLQMFHYVHASLLLIQTFAFPFATVCFFTLWTFFSTRFASFFLASYQYSFVVAVILFTLWLRLRLSQLYFAGLYYYYYSTFLDNFAVRY